MVYADNDAFVMSVMVFDDDMMMADWYCGAFFVMLLGLCVRHKRWIAQLLFLNDRGSDSFICGVMKALSEYGFELLFINAKPQRASCVGDVLCLPPIVTQDCDDGYLAVQKRQLRS